MIKFNKKGIYYCGKNRDFVKFLRNTLWMDITLEKLLKVKSNYKFM